MASGDKHQLAERAIRVLRPVGEAFEGDEASDEASDQDTTGDETGEETSVTTDEDDIIFSRN